MWFLSPTEVPMTGFPHRMIRRSTIPSAMVLFALAIVLPASIASAEPRFGDSTWVAPTAAFEGDLETSGPRVAERDHERTWETAIRTPFRVAFLPLRLLASGIEALGPVAEHFYPPGQRPKTTGTGLYV